jgi:GNAT superfamily N-acetyltransferase
MTTARLATLEDLPFISSMCVDMHLESRYSKYVLDLEKVEAKVAALIESPIGIVLVTANGFLMGGVTDFWFGPAKYAFEWLLYVKPEARGSSEAPALVKAYAVRAKELGAVDVHIENTTGVEVEKVERLFTKLGFARVGGNFVMEL